MRGFVVAGLFALMTVTVMAQVSFGVPMDFNKGWKFSLSDDSTYRRPEYSDTAWRVLNVPHDWSVEAVPSPDQASCTGYLPGGIGWYRKSFEIADTLPKHYIYFEGVYNRSDVYLNGHKLGSRPNGYASFMYDMTPYLQKGENQLAVRVDHSRSADSRWYTGSGIYRDVYLISAPKTHIAQWGVGYKLKKLGKSQAEIEVDVKVENPVKGMLVSGYLTDCEGDRVSGVVSVPANIDNRLIFKVKNPKLWSVDSPNLYTLHTELIDNGKRIDGSETTIGLRMLHFDADKGFFLNGNNMKLKGVCLHHDAGVLGSAVPRAVWKRRLQELKKLGVNTIRMSHNPQAPVVYDLCDELGLMVMDEASDEWEFPKRKWIKGWNVGDPGFQGSYDFFEEWIERDVADMVRRDRNHPSVILWSIGNEVDYPNDPYSHPVLDGSEITQPMYGGYKPEAPKAERIGKIAKRLARVVRDIDDSRPVTGALAGVVMSNETEYPEAVDVVGYNYTEMRYDEDHARYPGRVIYGSENRRGYQEWKAVKDRDFISGQFLWTGADYLGESGRWPSRGMGTGMLDFASFRKADANFRASLWSDEPFTYIGTYPRFGDRLITHALDIWNYEDGDKVRVVCYTNAPQARLLLNGDVVGEMKPMDEETGMIHWDIPFAEGTLRGEGYDGKGNLLSDYEIVTFGRPYALRAYTVGEPLSDDNDVAQVVVEVLDEEGNLVKFGDNEIMCFIEGPAELMGTENGDNRDMTSGRDRSHRAYGGRLLTYIRRLPEKPGEPVRVRFKSRMLKGTDIRI
ncbi:MAG: DUF4982 domain-containing protein [Muribaculaceae bacterium]|nr:DUF4982 domain-containing protein [Muribaculaceae bacterium]